MYQTSSSPKTSFHLKNMPHTEYNYGLLALRDKNTTSKNVKVEIADSKNNHTVGRLNM